jgi:hypothetical protein
MRIPPFVFAIFAAVASGGPLLAQERLADLLDDPATRLERPADRARIVARMTVLEDTRRQTAHDKAKLRNLPLRSMLPNGRVQEIVDFDGERPIYRTTDNANAAISTAANLVRPPPYSLTGSGVVIGLWDGGSGRLTHQEFGGRMTSMDGAASIDHATHVGGTLIASGVVAAAHGMAAGATVQSYDWNSDTTEMTARGATMAGEAGKIYLSNHSYGIVSGWNYVGNTTRTWEWNGSGSSSTSVDSDFGRYNTYTRDTDSLAFNAPYYLIFRSAGNDRLDNPSAGDTVSLTPGGSTVVAYNPATHPAGDGVYRGGFDTIGFEALAKNVLTIGSSADAVTGGLRDPSKALVSSFSSWGPTDDGRIKPDLVANGEELYSSLNGSDTDYGIYSGTSMATPNATGSAALLIQQYGNLFPGQAMRASTLKGLLIQTADDLGNAGPDYKYGWGLINVRAAADIIQDHHDFPIKQHLTETQLTTSLISRTQSFIWDGSSPITATLCWTDPAAVATTTADSRTPRLVNNLNLKIIAPNGTTYFPYVMPFVGTWTQASMDLPATTGVNNTDNVEQIRIGGPPASGIYQIVVSFSGTLTNGSQNYSLLLSGSSAEAVPPPPLTLATVSPASAYPGTVTVDLTGTGLGADTAIRLTRSGQSDILGSGVQMIGETLRCQVNLTGAAAGTWNVFATNPNAETATLVGAFTVNAALWSESFDGTVTGWTSQAGTGTNSWQLVTTQSKSPATSYFAAGPSSKSTTNLTSPVIPIPAGAIDLQLKFWQNYNLQSARDGGRLELSTDGGGTWFDITASGSGAAFASGGYNSTISTSTSDFNGSTAWSGNSGGFVESVINLTDTAKYAGKNFRIRWRIATNTGTASTGWYVDSIVLLGGAAVTNQTPVITAAATTSSGEAVTDPDSTAYQIIHTAATILTVSATDDAGEPALTYTWSVLNSPAHPVSFTTNASNAAKATTANFEAAGDYQIRVDVLDAQGLGAPSTVNVRVRQTATGLIVSPATATLAVGATQAFGATLFDQFSIAMATQPLAFTWSDSGGGSVSTSGVFAATTAGGPYTITASDSGFSNTASVTVTPAAASVTLGGLNATYDGAPKSVTATTSPAGLPLSITYDGSATPPTNAGTYTVVVTVTDPNYQGSTTQPFTIAKAAAEISLTDLTQTYDGSPKSAAISTSPAGLAFAVTYDGTSTPPIAAGSHPVSAEITDPNYQGSAIGSLVISPAHDYTAWTTTHFSEQEISDGLASDNADPDSDGLPNLAEYALSTDPRQFTPPLAATLDENGLTLTFTRPANLPDLTYAAESSADLNTWSPVPLELLAPGEIETLRARDPLTTGNPAARFLRLRFERQPPVP